MSKKHRVQKDIIGYKFKFIKTKNDICKKHAKERQEGCMLSLDTFMASPFLEHEYISGSYEYAGNVPAYLESEFFKTPF